MRQYKKAPVAHARMCHIFLCMVVLITVVQAIENENGECSVLFVFSFCLSVLQFEDQNLENSSGISVCSFTRFQLLFKLIEFL